MSPAEELKISKRAVPRTRVEVRRRRYDAQTTWLVSRNDWFELDELTDQVWLACDEGLTVEQIAQTISDRSGLAARDALAATILAIDHFRKLHLVDLDEA